MKKFAAVMLVAVMAAATASASNKASAKKKEVPATVVDAGTFDVLVNGKHVASETFKIQQQGDVNVTTSEVKALDGSNTTLNSTLEMTSAGELKRYHWKEVSPSAAESTIEVNEGLLVQHVHVPGTSKPITIPYLLPASTAVLDDYFFSQRELLIWRYLAGGCKRVADGTMECPNMSQLGIIIPRQQAPSTVKVRMLGTEKVTIKGVERELQKFTISAEDSEWSVWADPKDSFKVLRMHIPVQNTEIVRN